MWVSFLLEKGVASMQLRVSITNEEPRNRTTESASNEPIIELIRQLSVEGKWGKISDLPNEKRVAAIQSAANYHARRLSEGAWSVITRSQKEDDGTYSVFIRKTKAG